MTPWSAMGLVECIRCGERTDYFGLEVPEEPFLLTHVELLWLLGYGNSSHRGESGDGRVYVKVSCQRIVRGRKDALDAEERSYIILLLLSRPPTRLLSLMSPVSLAMYSDICGCHELQTGPRRFSARGILRGASWYPCILPAYCVQGDSAN